MASFRQDDGACFLPTITQDGYAFIYGLLTYRFRFLSLFTVDFQYFFAGRVRRKFLRTFSEDFSKAFRIGGGGLVLAFFRPASQRGRDLLEAGLPRASRDVAIRPCRAFSPDARVGRDVASFIRFGNHFVMDERD